MFYQGQPLTQPAPSVSRNTGHISDIFGLPNERHEAITETIKAHAADCFSLEGETKGFDSQRFLTYCPLDLQTPQEVAFTGFILAKFNHHYDRMITLANAMGSLLSDED